MNWLQTRFCGELDPYCTFAAGLGMEQSRFLIIVSEIYAMCNILNRKQNSAYITIDAWLLRRPNFCLKETRGHSFKFRQPHVLDDLCKYIYLIYNK